MSEELAERLVANREASRADAIAGLAVAVANRRALQAPDRSLGPLAAGGMRDVGSKSRSGVHARPGQGFVLPRHVERVFPRDDVGFVALVDEVALDTASAAELEGRLREMYPHVVVRARDLEGDLTQVWYVYRDGSWTATHWE